MAGVLVGRRTIEAKTCVYCPKAGQVVGIVPRELLVARGRRVVRETICDGVVVGKGDGPIYRNRGVSGVSNVGHPYGEFFSEPCRRPDCGGAVAVTDVGTLS